MIDEIETTEIAEELTAEAEAVEDIAADVTEAVEGEGECDAEVESEGEGEEVAPAADPELVRQTMENMANPTPGTRAAEVAAVYNPVTRGFGANSAFANRVMTTTAAVNSAAVAAAAAAYIAETKAKAEAEAKAKAEAEAAAAAEAEADATPEVEAAAAEAAPEASAE